ncbi:heme ABC transporter ATP-binding protein [Paenibacillus sacheonensis]|uniref:Heme ABC transporter ATP-binding protein n=1 Tax=Paenibacillus sacheonensis TaxID=742054 RepID=A0A7X4YPB6_9BACL|nr:heme ABC transporter ATP-binding protein [Paenibacillus sacheonensis]MBM7564705.1 iron complex transport system ATP-binding protein [Paenibacillus sacheonensis]NBC69261.1 heme ABC transporter ATP-binding protein [Paenibacillus sacheonensis]
MIEAKAVSLAIAGRNILHDVHFEMESGAMYGIIGPNGVGKSTLLRLLSGTEKPTTGTVLFAGRPVSGYKRKELAKQVAVLQQGGLPAVGFTVREAVRMGRFPYQNWLGEEPHAGEQFIERVLADMGLRGLEDRRVDGLSGGERQRVALAKVMAQEPELLLLDEPTTYLDIGYQIQLLDTVKRWQAERRLTVIAVLHDLNLAAHYCDKLLILREGTVEAFGSPQKVMNSEMIKRVFDANAVILPHPETGVPQLLLRPEAMSSEQRIRKEAKR